MGTDATTVSLSTPATAITLEAPASYTIVRKNMPELDTIRGVAILSVFLYHALFWFGQGANLVAPWRLVVQASQAGWLGVDLFFVLSGFLITGILLDAKSVANRQLLRSFYARRALRILPLYYLALATMSVVLLTREEVSPGFIVLSIVCLSNIALILDFAAGYPVVLLWSLSIEQHFYLFWPGIVKLASRYVLAGIAIGICLGEPLLRALTFHAGMQESIYLATWLRLDSLTWGAVLAILTRSPAFSREHFKILIIGLFGAALLMIGLGYTHGIMSRKQVLGAALQFTCLDMVLVSVLGAALLVGTSRYSWCTDRPTLRYLGRRSYCLYLFHMFLFWVFDKTLISLNYNPLLFLSDSFGSLAIRGAVVMAAGLAVAEISWRYLEAPLQQMKRHFAL